jgi:hypothetical protein
MADDTALESAPRNDIDAVAVVVQKLVDAELAKAGTVVPGSALDQAGLRDGLEVVRDYLEHDEPGVALDHVLYMIRELDLTIPADTYAALARAAGAMKVGPETLEGIKASTPDAG